ncbi:MAG: glycosyltransferase [Fimbriimonadaceae bacterium]
MKDPRTSLFAPLWQQAAASLGVPMASVLLLRHPAEVADSLQVRDGFSRGRAFALWLEYTLAAARAAVAGPHHVTTYEAVLDDWTAVVARLRSLPGGKRLDIAAAAPKVATFLDVGRRHHREVDVAGLPRMVREAWALLLEASRTGELSANRLEECEAALAPARELALGVLSDWQHRERQLWRRVAAAEGIVTGQAAGFAQFPAEIGELRERIDIHHSVVVSAITQDIQRMQTQLGEALAAASAREAEAGLARELSPRLVETAQRLDSRLAELAGLIAPVASHVPAELRALAEGLTLSREALVSAITEDIQRMQTQLGEALAAASAREAEAAIARGLSPRVGDLVETVDRTGRLLKETMDQKLSLMKEAIAEASKAQGAAEAKAQAAEARALAAEAQVSSAQEENTRLRAMVEHLSATVAKLETDLAKLHEERSDMVSRLFSLEHESRRLAEKEREFEKVLASRSWRWTRPLRVAARLATGRWSPADSQKWRALVDAWRGRAEAKASVELSPVLAGPTISVDDESHQASDNPGSSAIVVSQAVQGLPDVFVWSVIDWHFRFQRPQHLAKALAAKGHRVFYISNNFVDADAAGFRADALDDSGRLFQVHLHLKGAPPIYFALPSEAQAEQLSASLAELLTWTCTQSSLSLVQHPYWAGLMRAVPNARVVYDCMDHHGGFENNAPAILEAEDRLCRGADLVIVTSDWLQEEISTKARATAMVRNAGEFTFFRDPPAKVFRDPQGRKVIGYYGAIAEWFDLDLVRAVATAHPDHLVLLVGNDTVGASTALANLANVQFTGEVPYVDLPFWLHGFDVCLLPFKVTPLTLATNPVKVYEYLAAGKPVVAVQLPEMAQFGDLVATAGDVDGFVAAVSAALRSEPDADAEARRAFAAEQTWEHRAEELCSAIAGIEEPQVSVIVLTYNNLAFTDACLSSLEAYSDYRNLEIIVVDNASTDGSREWLERWAATPSSAGHVRRLILNDENLGFSAGNNVGLRAASGEYFVILNNDTYVTPGWVRTLIAHLRADDQLGLVGPVTNNIGNEAKIEIAYADMVEMIREAGRYTRRHPGRRYPMRNAAFFCVAMRRSTFETVGEMDEAFGVGFFEDDDYCRRVEQAGLAIACAEDVFVHHHLSASFDALKAGQKQALFERNKAIYEAKWGPWQPHTYRPGGIR